MSIKAQGLQPVGEPVRLGAIFNLQGSQSSLDIPSADGAVLAALEINRAGGIHGRPLQLLLRDGMTDIDRIREHTHALVHDDHVSLMLGLSDTDMVFTAALESARAGVPFLTSGATSPLLPAQVPDLLFLTCFGDNVQAAAAAEFAYRNPLLETAAIIVEAEMEYAIILARYFRAAFTGLGGRVIVEESFRKGLNGFEIALEKMATACPPAAFIFLACGPEEAGPSIRRLREEGWSIPIIGGDSLDNADLIRQAGALADNVFFTSHAFLSLTNPAAPVRQFIKDFQSEYHRPPENAFAALGYDAVKLAAEALCHAGSEEPAAVRDALARTVSFQGVTGELSYHDGSRIPLKRVSVVTVRHNLPSLADTILARQVPDP